MEWNLFARQGLSLERLRSFLLVADAGGMARAAPRQPARQSQLSRQIGELEEFFGQKLTERRGRTIALTAAGRQLAEVVRETLAGLSEVASTAGKAPVPVSLGGGDSVLRWWVLPRIGGAFATGPPASVTLVSLSAAEVIDRLLDARLDLGLVRRAELPRALKGRALGNLEYALYVPRAMLPKRSRADPLELMSALPLALQYSEPELNEPIERATRRAGVALRVALRCETFPQACRALRTGGFAAILPTLARDELDSSPVVEFRLPALREVACRISLAWHPRLERLRPNARPWIDLLEKALRL